MYRRERRVGRHRRRIGEACLHMHACMSETLQWVNGGNIEEEARSKCFWEAVLCMYAQGHKGKWW